MLVSPRPGVSRENLAGAFRDLSAEVQAVHNQHGSAHDRLTAYIEWAASAADRLRYLISDSDITHLIWTPGYHRLVTGLGVWTNTDQATVRAVNFSVSAELTQRQQAFDAATVEVQDLINRWPDHSARFAVADTSVYIEHRDKLDESLDFEDLLGLKSGVVPVRVIVPIIVIDELDNLKNRGDAHARWRASYNLAVFDRLFPGPRFTAAITNPQPKASVHAEILFDPPGHVRLPINDDELIDRVLAVQPLTGEQVTLFTCDTNQSMRARHTGLTVIKVPGDARSQTPARSQTSPTT